MGADGGVCWVRVTGDPKRFQALVDPFGFNRFDTWQDDKHNDWLREHADADGCEVATYGTSQDTQGYLDLETVLDEIFHWDGSHFDGCGDNFPEMTFEECLLAIQTRPTHWWDYKSELEEVLLESVGFWYFRGLPLHRPEHQAILDMNVLEWAKEIRSLIDMHSWGSAETWT